MDAVKTYHHVNPQAARVSFEIKRMEDIYDEHGGAVDQPHRHDYYILLLVRQAKGKHIVDFLEYPLVGGQVFFISPGQVHQLMEEERSIGCVLTFNEQFLAENAIDSCFLEDINLYQDYGASPPLVLDEVQAAELLDLTERIFQWKLSDGKFKDQAIGALLKLILIACNNICLIAGETNTQQVQAGMSILREFKQLVETHFQQEHQVNYYAERLYVTPDHLNRTVKSLLGKSAKEYIQNRLLVAAKRLLLFTDLPAKEIAFELGFSDPAYFSHFFKHATGESIMGFRKQV